MSGRTYLTAAGIADAFWQCGIRPGDLVMLHSDAMVAAQFPPMPPEARYDLLIDAILNFLGDDGTLVMPTFTYSFTKNEVFDVCHSPSTVGVITERFRQRSGVLRSPDPLFSLAAQGRLAEVFSRVSDPDCFSRQSGFGLLHQYGGHNVCLGCHLNSGVTFVHYIERCRGVDYRYMKTFSGEIVFATGERRAAQAHYYVRKLDRDSGVDMMRLRHYLSETKRIREVPVGRVGMIAIKTTDFFDAANELLDQDPHALIREGMIGSSSLDR